MGASEKGEIEKLCNIAKPDTGIITNVGLSHLEALRIFSRCSSSLKLNYIIILKKIRE